MRSFSTAIADALAEGAIEPRDFLWFTVRDRATGDPYSEGYWSDAGDYQANVTDPTTGNTVSRLYRGAGGMISAAPIVQAANLTVQRWEIRLSSVSDRVAQLLIGYDPRRGRVEMHKGLFAPGTQTLVAPAFPEFYGFVDRVQIETPEEGGEGSVIVTCVSATQGMVRNNPAMRSDEDQRRRSATDNFFEGVETAGEVAVFWGVARQ